MRLQGLVPVKRLTSHESKEWLEKEVGRKLPSYEVALDAARKLQTDPKYFYIDVVGFFRPILFVKDFLCVDMFDFDQKRIDGFAHESKFKATVDKFDEMLRLRDYVSLFLLVDSRIRMQRFVEHFEKIPPDQKFKVFCSVYTIEEFGFEDLRHYVEQIKEYRPQIDKGAYGSSIDKAGLVAVYRGMGARSTPIHMASSWTLDVKVARFFANRFDGDGKIYMAKVHHTNIIAYLNNRNESEVLLEPADLLDIECMEG